LWRRSPPNPRFGALIELLSSDLCGVADLAVIGKTLSCERLVAKQSPPAFLQIQPTGTDRNEDQMHSRMLTEPLPHRAAKMAGEVISYDEDVAVGIVLVEDIEQSEKPRGVACCCGEGPFHAIAHPQDAVDPHFLRTSPIIRYCFDAMSAYRPPSNRGIGARGDRPQFIGAEGRRTYRWVGVAGDDRRSFGEN
jgi:hypothetical protein